MLYLCLEDSFTRIQGRLLELTDEATDNLHFAIMSQAIGRGLEQQIADFMQEHPDTGMIVIDTLQKARKSVGGNVNPYANGYDDIAIRPMSFILQFFTSTTFAKLVMQILSI